MSAELKIGFPHSDRDYYRWEINDETALDIDRFFENSDARGLVLSFIDKRGVWVKIPADMWNKALIEIWYDVGKEVLL